MPVVGAATGGLDFSNYYVSLSSKVQQGAAYADAKKQGAVIGYSQFLTVAVNFLIVAAVLFVMIQALNKLKCSLRVRMRAFGNGPATAAGDAGSGIKWYGINRRIAGPQLQDLRIRSRS